MQRSVKTGRRRNVSPNLEACVERRMCGFQSCGRSDGLVEMMVVLMSKSGAGRIG